MNEEELTQKLKLMHKLVPSDHAMLSIRTRVYRETGQSDVLYENGVWKIIAWLIMPPRLALYGVMLLAVFGYNLYMNPIRQAGLAMNTAEKSLEGVESIEKLIEEEKNLDEANMQISKLNLHGEPGKYTREQCKEIYNKYENYLYRFKTKTEVIIEKKADDTEAVRRIYDKVLFYEAEAEAKWPKKANGG